MKITFPFNHKIFSWWNKLKSWADDKKMYPTLITRKIYIFVALMKLARPAPLSKVVRTICLPDPEEELANGHCITSGWGRYGPSQSLSPALLEASVPLLDLEKCIKAYGKAVPLRSGHLCAGNTDGSTGSCVVSIKSSILSGKELKLLKFESRLSIYWKIN